jgi:hypothetical protein
LAYHTPIFAENLINNNRNMDISEEQYQRVIKRYAQKERERERERAINEKYKTVSFVKYKPDKRYIITLDLRNALIPFLPENALDEVVKMLQKHSIHLTIMPLCYVGIGRTGKWGDYSYHSIRIERSLDGKDFLEVFLHEYAHLLTELSFNDAPSHSIEFYFCLAKLVRKFFRKGIISEFDEFHYNLQLSSIIKEAKTWNPNEYHDKIIAFLSNWFDLATIREGSQFEYNGEVFVKSKKNYEQNAIDCTRLTDGTAVLLKAKLKVNPVLDLCW